MLSIIVPTYQAEEHLPGLLASLDSCEDWETIIVDDGSEDETVRIAEEWLRHRRHGQLIRLEHGSPGRARQVGLEAASRDFVTLADADDRIIPTVLERAPDVMNLRLADVYIAQFVAAATPEQLDADLPYTGEVRRAASSRVLTARAAVWGKVYRRSFLIERGIGFPPLRSADDVIFSWRLAAARPAVLETIDVGYLYWVAPHGQLTGDHRYFEEGLQSLRLLHEEARTSDLFGRALGAYAYWKGSAHVMRKSPLSRRPQIAVSALTHYWRPRPEESK